MLGKSQKRPAATVSPDQVINPRRKTKKTISHDNDHDPSTLPSSINPSTVGSNHSTEYTNTSQPHIIKNPPVFPFKSTCKRRGAVYTDVNQV